MISVLINAYACAPNMGSEPGMAWNWIVNLAKECDVHIITEGEWKSEIEEALKELPQRNNIHFYYNPLPSKIRKICWNQGDWRFYYYYRIWQRKTLRIGKDIIKEQHIDIVHQLNMIGFREPGFLYELKKPFIWGPVDAKETFPSNYLLNADLKTKLFTKLKNQITKLQLKYSGRLKTAINKASYVVAASSNSTRTFKKYYNINSVLINETGCRNIDKPFKEITKKPDSSFNILWVGKFDFRKQLDLALKSIANSSNKNEIKFHIVGGEELENEKYKILAKKYNVSENCIWYGKIKHNEVQRLMKSCDLLFFTSVAEGTPHVVLESISNNLPVLCFNTCGQGDSINQKVGIKIELSNPAQSTKDFAEKIDFLHLNRDVLYQMKRNCDVRQTELSWENKVKKMIELYQNMINQNMINQNNYEI